MSLHIKYGATPNVVAGLHDVFFSGQKKKLVMRSEMASDVDSHVCYHCRRETSAEESAETGGCCPYCYTCPTCQCVLIRVCEAKEQSCYYLHCQTCHYTTKGWIEGHDAAELAEKIQQLRRGAPTTKQIEETSRALAQAVRVEGSATSHMSLDALIADAEAQSTTINYCIGNDATTLKQRNDQHWLKPCDESHRVRLLPVPIRCAVRLAWSHAGEKLVKPTKYPDTGYQLCQSATYLLARFTLQRQYTRVPGSLQFRTNLVLWNGHASPSTITSLTCIRSRNCSVELQGGDSAHLPITLQTRNLRDSHAHRATIPITFTVSDKGAPTETPPDWIQWVWEVKYESKTDTNAYDLTYYVVVLMERSEYMMQPPAESK
eukprot:PhM_4_TR19140/c0_g1_i1/m.13422